MNSSLEKVLQNQGGNYIFPFLWMKGESREVIKEEIEKICECGIRAICIESRPHPDFLGYANHLIPDKYPERKKVYVNYNVQDVWGASAEMTLIIDTMMKPATSWMDLGKPADHAERANNRPLAVTAYRLVEDSRLDLASAIDLMPLMENGRVTVKLPKGNWRVITVYETRTDGGDANYINIIDEDSVAVLIEAVYESHYQHYKDDFGSVFAGFFSDEPGFGNTMGYYYDDIIGKKQMPLPWNADVPGMLKERLGENWKTALAALWQPAADEEQTAQIRYAYMDVVTALYSKNFCGQLGRWCAERGVEYVGHVIEDNGQHARLGCGPGHYFRAMDGQHMAGIDSIGCQILPGGADVTHRSLSDLSGKFFHYVLAKLGSSAGHLDPKKLGRTLCEACGAYGWRFGVRDMKWLLDDLLAQGINYFVPHAFSMAEYPDFDCPPHFYARGNNPEFPHFAELMKYLNRMSELLNGGKHGANVAVLYQGEAEWMGEYQDMAEVARVLLNNQIDFDFIPADVLADLAAYEGGMSADGETLLVNGQSYKALVIPYAKYLPRAVDEFVSSNPKLETLFIDAYPQTVASTEAAIGTAAFAPKGRLLPLSELAAYAKENGLTSITLSKPFASILAYDYEKDGKTYMLFNSDLYDDFAGEVCIEGEKYFLIYDGMTNTATAADSRQENGNTIIKLTLPRYQSVLLIETAKATAPTPTATPNTSIDLSTGWQVSSCRSIAYPQFTDTETLETLEPYSKAHPEFSGYIRYEKEVTLDKELRETTLFAEHLYEVARLWVDDTDCGYCLTPPYRFALPTLSAGAHTLRIEVATTLDREQQTLPQAPFQYLWEPIEPTGMFGEITLRGNSK